MKEKLCGLSETKCENFDIFEHRTVCISKYRVIAGKPWRGKTLLFALQAIKHKGRMNIFTRIKLRVLIVKKPRAFAALLF